MPEIQMLGNIKETIFLNLDDVATDYQDIFMEQLVDFCIDQHGKVRKALGVVSYDEESDNDHNYVPRNNYGLERSPWNSHQFYLVLELPNPVTDIRHYEYIRGHMCAELMRRMATLPRKGADDADEAEG